MRQHVAGGMRGRSAGGPRGPLSSCRCLTLSKQRSASRHRVRPDLAETGIHPLDGARYLRSVGIDGQIVSLVVYCPCAQIEADGAKDQVLVRGNRRDLHMIVCHGPDVPHRGMRGSPTRPHLGLIDLIKALLHDTIRIVKCPPWRAPQSIQISDTWCTRCTSTAVGRERNPDCGTTPIAATSSGATAPSWVRLSWRQKNSCMLFARARRVSPPVLNLRRTHAQA